MATSIMSANSALRLGISTTGDNSTQIKGGNNLRAGFQLILRGSFPRSQARQRGLSVDEMWKRKQRSNSIKRRETVIGNPVLLESSYDTEALQRLPDVQEAQAAVYESVSPTGLPKSLPLRSRASKVDAVTRRQVVSHAPTVTSSIYSQPSPTGRYDRRGPRPYRDDVSPPSSLEQERFPGHHSSDGDVSPVMDEGHGEAVDKARTRTAAQGSRIPAFRKPTPGSPTQMGRLASSDTKWDAYSGEPTTAPTGKPAQVKPGDPEFSPQQPASKLPTNSAYGMLAAQKNKLRSVAERASNLATKGLAMDGRPAWKGASGREAIVPPVADKPGTGFSLSLGKSKKQNAPPSSSARSSNPTSMRRNNRVEAETDQSSVHNELGLVHETPEPMTHDKYSSDVTGGPESATYGPAAYPSPVSISDQPSALAGNSAQRRVNQASPTIAYSGGDKSVKVVQRKPTDPGATTQSDSRFSWTTHGTSTTYQHSPPPSPPPPMPTSIATSKPILAPSAEDGLNVSRIRPAANTNQSPILPSSTYPGSPTIRKPVGTGSGAGSTDSLGQPQPNSGSRVSSVSGAAKALPRTPQEMESQDLITSLQAQLDDLFRRRSNVQRVMRDLLSPKAQNPLLSDFRAEREKNKRLTALKDELADIGQQEHDTGLRLHRAQKRRDKLEGREGTTLWINRVTN